MHFHILWVREVMKFLKNLFLDYRQNVSGNFAMIGALSLPVLVVCIGASVDLMRVTSTKLEAQNAIDSAVLRVAVDMSRDPNPDLIDVKQRLNETVELNKDEKYGTVKFVDGFYDAASNIIEGTAEIEIKTQFIHLAGVNKKTLKAQIKAASGPISRVANVDVALVLDNTSSIGYQDLNTMVAASEDLVNFLHDNKGTANLRIAVVPFSRYVNIGSGKTSEDWIDYADAYNPDSNGFLGCVHPHFNDKDGDITDIPSLSNMSPAAYNYPKYPYTSSAPASATDHPEWWKYRWDTVDCNLSPVQTLTSSRSAALTAVQGMKGHTGGPTYLPAGLKWGQLMLHDQAPLPNASPPVANSIKTIVFMTDGGNKLYWMGETKSPSNQRVDAETDAMTKDMCGDIKGTGTNLMVIGFKLDQSKEEFQRAADVLESCVSSTDVYFNPNDRDGLKSAFNTIGKKVLEASIRLVY